MRKAPTHNSLPRYLLLALVLTLTITASAATRGIVEIPEPDHLIPVDPYSAGRHLQYIDQLRSRFRLDDAYYAQMVVRPSFSPE